MVKLFSNILIILLNDVDLNVNYKDGGFLNFNKSNFQTKSYLYSCFVDFKLGEDGKFRFMIFNGEVWWGFGVLGRGYFCQNDYKLSMWFKFKCCGNENLFYFDFFW